LIWALQTARVGDNAQVMELCRRLGGDVVAKQLDLNILHLCPNWALGVSLVSLSKESAGLLVPPWPDLVVAVGKRTAPIARWIKMASGGKSRLVHLGRPRSPLKEFDLVITTPQYGLPQLPNVLEIDLPFARPRGTTKTDLATWQREWQSLPKPLIAVVVGGAKFPLAMGSTELQKLGEAANRLARLRDGSLLVILSPRTNPRLASKLRAELNVPHRFYPWGPGFANPYQAALAIADEFVVTCDSASMISEAIYTGKPVNVFELPLSTFNVYWSARKGWGAIAAKNGWLQPPRNIRRISRELAKKGVVTMMGQVPARQAPKLQYEDMVINRLQDMLLEAIKT
jgi:uncharacterized protein